MLQYADYAGLITSLPTVEQVLDDHASELGHDLVGYRNHVYRVREVTLAAGFDHRQTPSRRQHPGVPRGDRDLQR